MKKYHIAVVGATGAVGTEMLKILEERDFPIESIRLFAHESEAGKKITFKGSEFTVEKVDEDNIKGIDIAFFAAGPVSKVLAPVFVKNGAVVIDNGSSFRLDPSVPLVIPEINPEDVDWHSGIISNPNCATIILCVPLKPIYDYAGVTRIIVSTYQAASGAGVKGIAELDEQVRSYAKGEPMPEPKAFTCPIAFNAIPHIDVFMEQDYTKEEWKMYYETRKIFHDPDLRISSTTVRIPVMRSHCESILLETKKKITPDEVRDILSKAPGVKVYDDPSNNIYPTPLTTQGQDIIYVGRIRRDASSENGIWLWTCGDQIRKGAATNTIQIGEVLIERGLLDKK
ncbi:MAG TPA: aspartate-semialdehyde dehydrogenase [Tepidanaerobacteraceae bacterium]|nr:aspartate-semialdehyde dehydrogenase [Tepidanaerobacteraceae bacterium]